MTRDGTTVVALGVIWKDEIELGVHESGAITVQVNGVGHTGRLPNLDDTIALCKALLAAHGVKVEELE